MAGGAHRLDGKYSIHTDQMRGLFAEILERDHEIGLHGSFDSYNNLEMLAAEKEVLEAVVGAIRGIRQHYLRFDLQSTWVIHEKLNFAYDTTLGFAEYEGFRAGFCLPFRPYHIEEDRPFDLLEIPLTIMDGTFSNTRYRGLNPEAAWQSVESLFSTVKRCGGCIALLWHNSHLDEFGHADYIDIYTRALKWIVENNGMTI